MILTLISGNILASSQASNELSTDYFTDVIIERCRESNPRKCLFFSKNSEIAICFWFLAILSAMPAMRITNSKVLLRPDDVGPQAEIAHRPRFLNNGVQFVSSSAMWARVIRRRYTMIQIVMIIDAVTAPQYVQSLPSFIATERSAAFEPQYA